MDSKRRVAIAAALALIAALLYPLVASAQEDPIVGRWQGRHTIDVSASGSGFSGVMVTPASGSCARTGDQVWGINQGSGGSYSGWTQFYYDADCTKANQQSTTFTLDSSGTQVRVSTSDPDDGSAFVSDYTKVAQCSDGVDNNGDGKTDYPNDPGCSSSSDATETAQCSDFDDNDDDGIADYPSDDGCESETDDSESDPQLRALISGTPEIVEIDDDVVYQASVTNIGSQTETEVELEITLNDCVRSCPDVFGDPTLGNYESFDGGCTAQGASQRIVCKVGSLAPGAEASVSVLIKAVSVRLRGVLVLALGRARHIEGVEQASVTTRIRPPCGATFEGAKVKCGSGTITGTNRDDILVGSDAKDTNSREAAETTGCSGFSITTTWTGEPAGTGSSGAHRERRLRGRQGPGSTARETKAQRRAAKRSCRGLRIRSRTGTVVHTWSTFHQRNAGNRARHSDKRKPSLTCGRALTGRDSFHPHWLLQRRGRRFESVTAHRFQVLRGTSGTRALGSVPIKS